MKERPILFSSAMVRAILEGRKTQTRRVIKPQPVSQGMKSFGEAWKWNEGKDGWFSGATAAQISNPNYGLIKSLPCPYGVPGDRLWVRETFAAWRHTSVEYPLEWDIVEGKLSEAVEEYGREGIEIAYRADGDDPDGWRPSIFMPRWASRITLEITDVRVQRLQEISEEDAEAEGAEFLEHCGTYRKFEPIPVTYRYGFQQLWDSINAKRGFGWERTLGYGSCRSGG